MKSDLAMPCKVLKSDLAMPCKVFLHEEGTNSKEKGEFGNSAPEGWDSCCSCSVWSVDVSPGSCVSSLSAHSWASAVYSGALWQSWGMSRVRLRTISAQPKSFPFALYAQNWTAVNHLPQGYDISCYWQGKKTPLSASTPTKARQAIDCHSLAIFSSTLQVDILEGWMTRQLDRRCLVTTFDDESISGGDPKRE